MIKLLSQNFVHRAKIYLPKTHLTNQFIFQFFKLNIELFCK
ncbi:unnamed protein product [Paramecium sonneborni]|uniref:Uncharacterized protein n=1 Tax=Paramecium sonneborni TaxID=65129 RepID=A0A8S1RQR1_9CILI|nr:unnamed protein product [Paramecium sonneborni]